MEREEAKQRTSTLSNGKPLTRLTYPSLNPMKPTLNSASTSKISEALMSAGVDLDVGRTEDLLQKGRKVE
jgi:hypothetical protein